MSMARVVITAVVVEGRSKSEVARDYGVSRRWVQTLVARYQAEGDTAFEPRSRRPHSNPRHIGDAAEDQIVALRKELAEAGHDAGAETIAWHLNNRTGSCPSIATIWRVLARRGFITPQPHKRPRSSWRRFEADLPNEVWQADITHWPLADGTEAEILNIIDDHSRLLAGSTARTIFKAGHVVADLHLAMNRHGRPERMLTDNGAVFTGRFRGRGWVALERELVALGIGPVPLPALPSPDLRQSRTPPPDPQELARPPRPRRRHRRPTNPARHLRRLLQPQAATPRRRPANPRSRLERPATCSPGPARTDLQRTLPSPQRPRRQQQTHPAPQQQAAPHRHRPRLGTHPDTHAHPRT